MTTTEKINQELEQIKLKLKIAKACELVVDSFLNKDELYFTCPFTGNKIYAIKSENIFSCYRISLTSSQIKHFEDLHKISFDKKSGKTSKLYTALKLIEKNEDISYSILSDIYDEKS